MFWILLAVLLFPASAFAFGPVAHLDMGMDLIASAALFGAGVRRLIGRHPDAFLRGILDPDRSLAKNLAPYRRHSHNWVHAFRQYETARIEAERAVFLGYICHLAADTVAHNLYVPERMVASAGHLTAGHLYWESRLDARLREQAGAAVERLRQREPREHRRLLHRTVRNILPGRHFQVRLTGLVMRAQGQEGFGRMTMWLDRRSRISLDDDRVRRIWSLALSAQRQVLRHLREAPVLAIDPRGLEALAAARALRRIREVENGQKEGAGTPIGTLREAESRLLQALGDERGMDAPRLPVNAPRHAAWTP